MLSLLKARIEISKLVHDWRLWSEAIARATVEVLGPCDVYVFGSVIEGCITGASDVDILIVADQLPGDFRLRGDLTSEIEEVADLPLYHPFEIHLVSKDEAEANPIYRAAVSKGIALPLRKVEEV